MGISSFDAAISHYSQLVLNMGMYRTINNLKTCHLNYLLNCDFIPKALVECNLNVNIYQGHHGNNVLSSICDILLPEKTFVETNNLFTNCFGTLQQSNRVASPAPLTIARVG